MLCQQKSTRSCSNERGQASFGDKCNYNQGKKTLLIIIHIKTNILTLTNNNSGRDNCIIHANNTSHNNHHVSSAYNTHVEPKTAQPGGRAVLDVASIASSKVVLYAKET